MDEIRIKLHSDVALDDCDKLSEQGIFILENKVYDENVNRSLEYLAICKTEEHKKVVNALNASKWATYDLQD